MVGVGAAGDGDYNASLHANRLQTDVAYRDTTRFRDRSWLVLRYIADNPGVWLIHCHVSMHVPGGMAAVIVEGQDILKQNFAVPAQTMRICKAAGIHPPNSNSVAKSLMAFNSGALIAIIIWAFGIWFAGFKCENVK